MRRVCASVTMALLLVLFVSGCARTANILWDVPLEKHDEQQLLETAPKATSKMAVIVSKVIDGDTIKLTSGETVRLIGINAPESEQPYYEEARDRLKELVRGKIITLEKDVEDKDRYGRLLRYVFVDNENINIRLVKEGLALTYIVYPNEKYEIQLTKAESEAMKAGLGLWASPEPKKGENICDENCLMVSRFHWNAAGNDCNNLNDEYVVFGNNCSYSCDLTGWTIKDESSREPYVFPGLLFESGAEVTIYTGCGADTKTRLYWCSNGYSCNAVWNNEGGDTLYLRNADGELVLRYFY